MPRPVPVALFVDRYAPGGTQRQILEVLRRLDRRRFRVYPVCFHGEGEWFSRLDALEHAPAVFPIQGFRRPYTARQLLAFARWCRERRVQVLHTFEVYSNIFGLPAAALAQVPVRIGSRRGLIEPRGLRRLQRAAYAGAHRIVANSIAAADQLCAEGVPAERVLVIPNGLDPALFPARGRARPPRRLGVVACLREEKRLDVLIAAAPRILARHPDAEIRIAGEGECRSALEAQARALGVASRVAFLGHRDDVQAVLAESDIFVLPSRSEAFPNAVLEAMASGLPVVASAVGGIPELVAEGCTGRLVPPGNPEALAAAVIDVMDDPERAAGLGRAGRQRIEDAYTIDRMVDRFERLYAEELDARLSAAPSAARAARTRIKHGLMRAYVASGVPAVRQAIDDRFGRGRLTVLVYHQIGDPANDCSTVGTQAFRQQMEFLASRYRILPLRDAVAAAEGGGHVVAITLDDGYKDNATVAAPILRALALPATFFVSTGMVGNARPFLHDLEQRRPPQQHMTWDDLRALAADGFEIGSHTVTHANLGVVPLAEAEHELRASRLRLEAELNTPVRLFAFPYGHRHNMRPETMAAARREYDVCCAADGGHNVAPIDPGLVRRIVISTGVAFPAFRALLEGWPMFRLENPYRAPEPAGDPVAS